MEENIKDISKKSLTSGQITNEIVTAGCMQRIADATELMSKNYGNLISDRNYYEKRYNIIAEENKKLSRRLSALQGVITKLKKKK